MAPISNATRLADFGSGIGTEGAVLKIDNNNQRVGIGSTVPASLLQVGLGITIDGTGMDVSGIITAKQFIGGGINTAASTNLTHLTVSGVTTFSGDVLVGSSATVGFGSTVFFKDGNKLYFGNGEDFSIYHDGSHSYIDDTGTGGLFIDASVLTLRDDNDENYAVFTSDGSTDLYFNNSKKFETTNSGSIITGILTVTSDVSIGGTLTYEDVTNIDSVGVVTARDGVNVSGGQLIVGSGITMGIAGVATFSGTSDVHLLDSVVLKIGDSSDLQLYHNGSNSYITGANTGNLLLQAHGNIKLMPANGEDAVEAVANDAVKLYYNNSQKFQTTNDGTSVTGIATATGVDVTSNLTVGSGITMGSAGVATFSGTSDVHLLDNIRLNIGDSSDLTLYHDGSTSKIVNTSGTLDVGVNNFVLHRQGLDETMLTAVANGAVSLYYNDSVKLATTNDGTVTTGVATATGLDVADKITHTGDANTAIRFPAADTVTVETAGNERARIDASGQLGIGTNSPSAKFVVSNGGNNGFEFNPNFNSNNSIIASYNRNPATDDYTQLTFSASQHIFAKGGTEYGRFNASGYLGIGTITPAGRLHIAGGDSPSSRIEIDRDNGGVLYLGSTGSAGYIQTPNANPIDVYTAASKRVTVGSGGDIDICGSAAGITSVTWDASANIMYFKDKSYIYMGDGGDFRIKHDGTNTDLYNNTGWLNINSAGGTLYLQGDYIALQPSGGGDVYLSCTEDAAVDIYYDNSKKFQTTNDGVVITGIATATSFTDDLGSLRTIPKNNQTGAYVLVAGDVGKTVYISTGGVTINQNVFSSGDLVTIINNSGSTQTITQGSSFTLYNTTDAATGNKTLNARGICTVWFADHNVGYISGNFA